MLKPTGSSAVPTTQMILEALGTSFDGIDDAGGDVIQVETAQIPTVVRDGQADVYFDTIVRGHPVITEVTLTGDVSFLDLVDAQRTLLEFELAKERALADRATTRANLEKIIGRELAAD